MTGTRQIDVDVDVDIESRVREMSKVMNLVGRVSVLASRARTCALLFQSKLFLPIFLI